MPPRKLRRGGGNRASCVVTECLVDIHLSDPRFHNKDQEQIKNIIENWRKKGETWFEIVERFGLGMMLLVPHDEPDS
jgi:hypothetical protein